VLLDHRRWRHIEQLQLITLMNHLLSMDVNVKYSDNRKMLKILLPNFLFKFLNHLPIHSMVKILFNFNVRAMLTIHSIATLKNPLKGPKNDASAMPLNLFLASFDLDSWPPDPESWPIHVPVPWTSYANWHQNQFIRFQNIMLTSLVV